MKPSFEKLCFERQAQGFTAFTLTGTNMTFEPPLGIDTIEIGGENAAVTTRLMCITEMESYKNSSLEELRVKYYEENVISTTTEGKEPPVFGEDASPRTGAKLLAKNFEDAFKNTRFSDIILKAGYVEFPAHKVILSIRSKVFDSNMKESEENVMNLTGTRPSTAREMLRYIYTGKIREKPSIELAKDLYIAADRYELPELKQCCKDFILNNVSPDSVCDVAALASMHSDEDLEKAAKRIIRNDLQSVMQSEKWLWFSKSNPAFNLEILQGAMTDDTDSIELREEYDAEDVISTTTGRKKPFLNPPVFGDNSFPNNGAKLLAENFEDAFKNPGFSDVIVKAGDSEFPAHKIILSTRSKVFERMFEKESEENVVNLEKMEPSAAEDMLSYIYTGKISEQLSVDRARELYIAANRYYLPELKQCSKDFILKHISPDSVCDVAVIASMHRDEDLYKAAKRIIRNDLQSVMKSEKWLSSSKRSPAFFLGILQKAMTEDRNRRSHLIVEGKNEATSGTFPFGTPQAEAANPFQKDFNVNTPPSFNFGATVSPAEPYHFEASKFSDAASNRALAARKYKRGTRRVSRKLSDLDWSSLL